MHTGTHARLSGGDGGWFHCWWPLHPPSLCQAAASLRRFMTIWCVGDKCTSPSARSLVTPTCDVTISYWWGWRCTPAAMWPCVYRNVVFWHFLLSNGALFLQLEWVIIGHKNMEVVAVSSISTLSDVFVRIQWIEEVFLNVWKLKNECNPPQAELGVEAGGALAAALLAISLVCLNIVLVITVRLLESVRAYCLNAEHQLI